MTFSTSRVVEIPIPYHSNDYSLSSSLKSADLDGLLLWKREPFRSYWFLRLTSGNRVTIFSIFSFKHFRPSSLPSTLSYTVDLPTAARIHTQIIWIKYYTRMASGFISKHQCQFFRFYPRIPPKSKPQNKINS